jgi:hypothetical protein
VSTDSVPPFYFAFVGTGEGDYSVDFVNVGTGYGAYVREEDESDEYYRYVGARQGDYDILWRSTPPISHSLYDLGARWEFGERGFFESEFAFSSRDPNTSASTRDEEHAGRAFSVAGAASSKPLTWNGTRLGTLGISGRLRSVEHSFEPFADLHRQFLWREWNASPGFLSHGEFSRELGLEYLPSASTRLGVKLLGLSGGELFSGTKQVFEVDRTGRLRLHASLDVTHSTAVEDSVDISGRGRNFLSSVSYDAGFVRQEILFNRETRIKSGSGARTGTRSDELTARLSSPATGNLSLGVLGSWKHVREARNSLWAFSSQTLSTQLESALRGWRGVSLSSVYSLSRVLRATGAAQLTDLARLELSQITRDGRIKNNVSYLVNSQELDGTERFLTYVGNGNGEYDHRGFYTGTGDFTYRSLARSGLAGRLEFALRSVYASRTRSERYSHSRGGWSNFAVTTTVRTRQSFSRDGLLGLNPFGAKAIQKESTILGQMAEFFPGGDRLTYRLEWRHSQQITRLQQTGSRVKQTLRCGGGVNHRYSPRATVEVRGSYIRQHDGYDGSGDVSQMMRMDCLLGYRMSSQIETRLGGAAATESGGRRLVELTPTVSCGVFGKGRANVRVKWARVFPESEAPLWDSVLGHAWYRTFEYQADIHRALGQRATLSCSISGRKHDDGKLINRLQTELRAFF